MESSDKMPLGQCEASADKKERLTTVQALVLFLPMTPAVSQRSLYHQTLRNDGALYTCGMFVWAGNATTPGGFLRIRRSEKPAQVPPAVHAK